MNGLEKKLHVWAINMGYDGLVSLLDETKTIEVFLEDRITKSRTERIPMMQTWVEKGKKDLADCAPANKDSFSKMLEKDLKDLATEKLRLERLEAELKKIRLGGFLDET